MALYVDYRRGYNYLSPEQRQEQITRVDMASTRVGQDCPVCQLPVVAHTWIRVENGEITECGSVA